MSRTVYLMLAAIIVLTGGCRHDEVPAEVPRSIQLRTVEVLRAAARGDSTAVWRLTSDSLAAQASFALVKREPSLPAALENGGIPIRPSEVGADSAYVYYSLKERGGRDPLAVGLVRRDTQWLVYYLGFPERM